MMIRTGLWCGVVLLLLAVGPVSRGQEAAALIEGLGAATWAEREAAQAALAVRLAAEPEVVLPGVLKVLATSDDPEVRLRLDELLLGGFTVAMGTVMLREATALADPHERDLWLRRLRLMVLEALWRKPKGYLGAHIQQDFEPILVPGQEEGVHGIQVVSIDAERNCLTDGGVVDGDRLLRIGPYWCRKGEFEVRDLIAYVACLDPGETLELVIGRGGEVLTRPVVLAERPERAVLERTAEYEDLFYTWWLRLALERLGAGVPETAAEAGK